jgi:hypothetical protein
VFSRTTIDRVTLAADDAYFDEILFEDFQDWFINRDDEVFLYLIDHYCETKDKPCSYKI